MNLLNNRGDQLNVVKKFAFSLGLLAVTSLALANPNQRPLVFLFSSGNSMPMLELNQGQPVRGILKDVAMALAEQLQRPPRFMVLPRKRLENEMQSGSADLYCYTNPQWFAADVQWSEPLIRNHDVIATRAETTTPKTIAELKSKTIGTVLGYHYPEIEQALGKYFVRDDGLTDTLNLKKLLALRHDYMLISEIDFLFQRGKPEFRQQLNADYLRFSSYDNYCALSRNSTIRLNELNAAIDRLKKQNRITAIQSQYN